MKRSRSDARADLYWDLDEKSATMQFLRRYYVTGSSTARISHASMTMGKFFVPHDQMQNLHAAVVRDLEAGGFVPPLSEQHSRLFNFYLDLDMQLPCSQLTQECLHAFTRILKDETKRFFPDAPPAFHEKLYILVCTKESGRGRPLTVKTPTEWELCGSDQDGREIEGVQERATATDLLATAYELAEARRGSIAFQKASWNSATRHGAGGGQWYRDDFGDVWHRDLAEQAEVVFRKSGDEGLPSECAFGEVERLLAEKVKAARRRDVRFALPETAVAELAAISIASDQVVVLPGGVRLRPVARVFKHGLHAHWSPCVVDVARAYQMRRGVVLAFARHASELASFLGVELEEADWEDIVDESVYNTGLRMLGAPKATQVRTVNAAVPWRFQVTNGATNITKFFAVDPDSYGLDVILKGDVISEHFEEGAAALPPTRRDQHFTKFMKRALEMTSVRCHDDVEMTPGFFAHSGLHTVTQPVSGQPSKRKKASKADDKKALGRDHGGFAQILDPRKLALLKTMLIQHSGEYKECEIKAFMHSKKKEVRVQLTNIGCTFCLNKAGFHSKNRAYMIVCESPEKKNKVAVSSMRCWSTKEQLCGVSCKIFKSIGIRSTLEEHAILFSRSETPSEASGGASSSTALVPSPEPNPIAHDLPGTTNERAGRRIAALLAGR